MAPAGRCPLANSNAPAPTDPKMTAFFQFSIAPPARAGLEEMTREFVVCGPDLSLPFYAGMVGAALHRHVHGAACRGNPEPRKQRTYKEEAWPALVLKPRKQNARWSPASAA